MQVFEKKKMLENVKKVNEVRDWNKKFKEVKITTIPVPETVKIFENMNDIIRDLLDFIETAKIDEIVNLNFPPTKIQLKRGKKISDERKIFYTVINKKVSMKDSYGVIIYKKVMDGAKKLTRILENVNGI